MSESLTKFMKDFGRRGIKKPMKGILAKSPEHLKLSAKIGNENAKTLILKT